MRVIHASGAMRGAGKLRGTQVQANIVGSCIGQRTESSRSYSRIVLKNQADGGLYGHGDGELPGAGLCTGAGGQ